jgi:flagellar biosynthetic protein FliR
MDLFGAYLNVPVFAMVASRLAGLIMFQPLLSSMAIPINLRALFVLALAMLVTPFVSIDAATPSEPAAMAMGMAFELSIGLLVGSVLACCFMGLQMAGLLIAQESGLAFGQIADPTTGDEQSVLSSFYLNVGLVAFMILGGHRAVLLSCLHTFDAVPLLGGSQESIDATVLVDAVSLGAQVAVRIAAPAVITLFLLNIALGFISRTIPQLNIATVGFSLKGLVGFLIMAVSLPTAMGVFADQLETIVDWIETIIQNDSHY